MLKATRPAAPHAVTDRVTTDTMHLAGRTPLVRGTEVSVDGIRGRCRFVAHTTRDGGVEWVDVIHVRTGRSRTVRPDAIRTVHRRVGRA